MNASGVRPKRRSAWYTSRPVHPRGGSRSCACKGTQALAGGERSGWVGASQPTAAARPPPHVPRLASPKRACRASIVLNVTRSTWGSGSPERPTRHSGGRGALVGHEHVHAYTCPRYVRWRGLGKGGGAYRGRGGTARRPPRRGPRCGGRSEVCSAWGRWDASPLLASPRTRRARARRRRPGWQATRRRRRWQERRAVYWLMARCSATGRGRQRPGADR